MANNNPSSTPDLFLVNPFRKATTNPLNKKFKQQQSVVSMGYKTVIDCALTSTPRKINTAVLRHCLELDKAGNAKEGLANEMDNAVKSDSQALHQTNNENSIYNGPKKSPNWFIQRWQAFKNSPNTILDPLDDIADDVPGDNYKITSKALIFIAKLIFGQKKRQPKRLLFDQLIGLDTPVSQMREILKRIGKGTAPTGVLIHGPDRTGKTTLAEALAYEAKVAFIPILGADIVKDKDGEVLLMNIITEARSMAPSIILIQGVDAVVAVDKLMRQMDFIERDGVRVLFVATTENMHKLDPRLLNSLTSVFHVDKPDLQSRKKMADVLFKKVVREEEREEICKLVANETPGLVWRDIALICKESCERAGGDDALVTLEHISFEVNLRKSNKRSVEAAAEAKKKEEKEAKKKEEKEESSEKVKEDA